MKRETTQQRIEREVERRCRDYWKHWEAPAPPSCQHASELIELAKEIEAVRTQLERLSAAVDKHVLRPFEDRFVTELRERTGRRDFMVRELRGEDVGCQIPLSERLERGYASNLENPAAKSR